MQVSCHGRGFPPIGREASRGSSVKSSNVRGVGMPVSDDATYQSAWNEAMRRVVIRDTTLLGYVAAAGTLIATSLQKQNGRPELALAVPFVTFVAGNIIAHHDFMIGRLNRYLRGFRAASENRELWHSA